MTAPGDSLRNRYQILESLGRGGMADVFLPWIRVAKPRSRLRSSAKIGQDPEFFVVSARRRRPSPVSTTPTSSASIPSNARAPLPSWCLTTSPAARCAGDSWTCRARFDRRDHGYLARGRRRPSLPTPRALSIVTSSRATSCSRTTARPCWRTSALPRPWRALPSRRWPLHASLHEPGADPRTSTGSPHGHLQPGHCAVRDGHGPAALYRRRAGPDWTSTLGRLRDAHLRAPRLIRGTEFWPIRHASQVILHALAKDPGSLAQRVVSCPNMGRRPVPGPCRLGVRAALRSSAPFRIVDRTSRDRAGRRF